MPRLRPVEIQAIASEACGSILAELVLDPSLGQGEAGKAVLALAIERAVGRRQRRLHARDLLAVVRAVTLQLQAFTTGLEQAEAAALS